MSAASSPLLLSSGAGASLHGPIAERELRHDAQGPMVRLASARGARRTRRGNVTGGRRYAPPPHPDRRERQRRGARLCGNPRRRRLGDPPAGRSGCRDGSASTADALRLRGLLGWHGSRRGSDRSQSGRRESSFWRAGEGADASSPERLVALSGPAHSAIGDMASHGAR